MIKALICLGILVIMAVFVCIVTAIVTAGDIGMDTEDALQLSFVILSIICILFTAYGLSGYCLTYYTQSVSSNYIEER